MALGLRTSRIKSLRDYSKLFLNSRSQNNLGNELISRFSNISLFKRKSNILLCSYTPSLTWAYKKNTAAEMLGLPRPPKKPSTPFLLFVTQEGERYPTLPYTEKLIKFGRDWSALDESSKAKYKDQYEKDAEIYRIKQSKYLESLSPEQIEEIKELKTKIRFDKKVSLERKKFRKECERMGRPKHPGNGVTAFIEAYKLENKLPQQHFLSTMSKKWNDLSKSEQDKFKLIAAKKLSTFKEDLRNWENKMRKAKRFDLVSEEVATSEKSSK